MQLLTFGQNHAKNEQCTTILLTKMCIKWIDSMIDTAEKAHSKAVIIIPLHSSAQWDWVSNKNIINSLNLLFIMSTQWQLYSPVSFTPSCIHHSYRFFLKWVHRCCCCQAKQSSSSLCVQIQSTFVAYTFYILYMCKFRTHHSSWKAENQVLFSNFLQGVNLTN